MARRRASGGSASRKATAAPAIAARAVALTSTSAGSCARACRGRTEATTLAAAPCSRPRRVSLPIGLRILDGAAVGARDGRLHWLSGRHRFKGDAHVVVRALHVGLARGGTVVDRACVDQGARLVDYVHVGSVRGAVEMADHAL